MVSGCNSEADYRIDTEEGLAESLLTGGAPDTFNLCAAHMSAIGDDYGGHHIHLHVDTGGIIDKEIWRLFVPRRVRGATL